jgi:phosphoadenosine phosphosulfate reductase
LLTVLRAKKEKLLMQTKKMEELKNLPLNEKINRSRAIINDAMKRFTSDELYITWTGGKDSTTMLWLFREVCIENGISTPPAIFIDEGSVFKEIIELLEKVKNQWGTEVCIVKNTDVSDKAKNRGDLIHVSDLNERNRKELKTIQFSEKSFRFEPESFVGNHLMKTVSMNIFIEENGVKALSTAIRWDEQEARLNEEYLSSRTNPDHMRIHPILHFSERDIWNTIHTYKIPFCSLYNLGYRSLGAKCSTTKNSDIPAWEQDLENTPERAGRGQDKEEVMAQLRLLGYM